VRERGKQERGGLTIAWRSTEDGKSMRERGEGVKAKGKRKRARDKDTKEIIFPERRMH
jgi:hypothetical protein